MIQWRCPNPVNIHFHVLNPSPHHHQTSPGPVPLISRVQALRELPHSALVHFRGCMGQVVVVSAAVQGQ